MGSAGEGYGKKSGRKLLKKRKPLRQASVQYPERLQPGEDAQEDVTAPNGKIPQSINQSVFSMIAAAGSKSEFHARFNDDSSGSEDEPDSAEPPGTVADKVEEASKAVSQEQQESQVNRSKSSVEKQKKLDTKLRRSLPKLNLRTIKEKTYMSRSSILPSATDGSPERPTTIATPRDAPVMSRMLEAQAQISSSTADLRSTTRLLEAPRPGEATEEKSKTSLKARLMEIFNFARPEEVVAGVFIGSHCLF